VTGAGTEVCIIDTGVDPNHEQLDSKMPIPSWT
jgi:subtilisin family serine protease